MFAAQQPSAAHVALLTAAPFVGGALAHIANALHSSRTGERRAHIAIPWILAGAIMATVPAALLRGAPAAAFGLFCAASTLINAADGPDVSWVTSLMGARERPVGLAAVNMFANVGGFLGARTRAAVLWAAGGLSTWEAGRSKRIWSPARRSGSRPSNILHLRPLLSTSLATPQPPHPKKGPYVIGAMSGKTGSFNGGLWFVAGVIAAAGTAVALFPMRWATFDDAPVIASRAASALSLRRASRALRDRKSVV